MSNLGIKIESWLLSANKAAEPGDYLTAQEGDLPDAIVFWNRKKLGKQPTNNELNAVTLRSIASVRMATNAIRESDSIALQCFMSGIPFPVEWIEYVDQLRLIARLGTGVIPTPPKIPEF